MKEQQSTNSRTYARTLTSGNTDAQHRDKRKVSFSHSEVYVDTCVFFCTYSYIFCIQHSANTCLRTIYLAAELQSAVHAHIGMYIPSSMHMLNRQALLNAS